MVTTDEVLRHGELTVEGRLVVASNLTVLATAVLDDVSVGCVYKPIAGERPLWDFPDGTLAGREAAAYVVSEAAQWGLVPVTVLRTDGPLGAGMCQQWIEQADNAPAWVDVVEEHEVGDGVLPILNAVDGDGRSVVVVHRDDDELRQLALFDVIVNNADRKGGHVLHGAGAGAAVLGVDHGVSFHVEPKLRTVLWGWAGSPLVDSERRSLEDLRVALDADGELRRRLTDLLDVPEIDAIDARVADLLKADVLPHPEGPMPVPWPVI